MTSTMKRVGLIDNLGDVAGLLESRMDVASARDFMDATGGNTGNVAFVFGAKRVLGNPLTRVGWGWTPEVVRKRVDHIVICCANQLGAHADLGGWADRLAQFQLPVTLLGLGAQSESPTVMPVLPEGTKRFLEVVAGLNGAGDPHIAVRGEFSASVLRAEGVESVSIGCPSMFCSPVVDLGAQIARRPALAGPVRVAVAAGNPWHGPSALLERTLVEVVDRYRGDYVVQHPETMLQFARGEKSLITEKSVRRFLEVYGSGFDFESLLAWYRANSSIFVDAGNWMCHLRKFDGVVGPRFHGVALGVQVGIPGLVIAMDARTEELAGTTGIKQLPLAAAGKMSVDDLVAAVTWSQQDGESFDANRVQRATALATLLESNGLVPSDHLRALGRSA
jgi:hypothetical protein